MKFIEQLRELFRAPSAEVLAVRELEECKRKLLEAQSAKEYAAAMCDRYESAIYRLTEYIRGTE